MQWSWRIGRFQGTDIKLHASFVLVFLLIWNVRQPRSLWDVVDGVILVVVLFGSVLLHEIGHAVAARSCGIAVGQIILWPLGGLALLAREPTRHRQAIGIAAAGPLVNIALVVLTLLLAGGLRMVAPDGALVGPGSFDVLAVLNLTVAINIGLAVFNLLPAYPLDGGRMLRAGLAALLGESIATRVTIVLSAMLAAGLLVLAVLSSDALLALTAVLMLLATATLHPQTAARLTAGWTFVFDRPFWHLQRNEPLPAIALYDRILARQPTNVRATHNRAWAHLLRFDTERAIPDYDRVIALTPHEAKPYADRGLSAYMAFRMDEALAYYDRAAALGLDAPWLTVRRGYALRCLDDHAAAFAAFDRAVAQTPNEHAAYTARALEHLRLGRPHEALADIDHALALQPGSAEWWVYRSQICWHIDDQRQAADDAAHAMSLDQHTALVHDEHCLLALWRGEGGWADAFYRWAEERPCDAEQIAEGHGDALRINDEHERALVQYDRAIAIAPAPATLLGRARSHAALGNTAQAIADYRQVLATTDLPNLVQLARHDLERIEHPVPTPTQG